MPKNHKVANKVNRRNFLAGSALGLAVCAPVKDAVAAPAVSIEDKIMAAEQLLGVQYTQEERQQLLAGFETPNQDLQKLRAFEKPNGLAPASVFDPRLPDKTYPSQGNTLVLSKSNTPLPASDSDIAYAGVRQQSEWLASGALTSERLTTIYLQRIKKYAPKLECFITVMGEQAMVEARKADAEYRAGNSRGPLHGIPYAAKDLFDTDGVKTTYGATPFKDRVPDADAAVITTLRQAGAILLGKTTLGALAYGDIWFGGKTRNPWNPAEGSSGSSAGSSASVSAGLCSFALGTETLGSIVSPATRCGIFGLRPSFGRISRAGAMALCWSMDKVGPLTRHAEDTALVLSVLNGHDVHDAGTLDIGFDYDGKEDLSHLRAAYDPAWFENTDDNAKAALETFKKMGIKVEAVPDLLPDLPYGALSNILLAESAAAFEEITLDGRDASLKWQDDAAWPNTFRAARFITAIDLIQSDRLRRRVMAEMHAIYERYDLLISPPFSGGLLQITNYTGSPCTVMPSGFINSATRTIFGQATDVVGPTAKVPTSIVLWGRLLEDGRLVRVSKALQARMGVGDIRPPLFP